tara:strand:+ start:35 stop:193 length:159 start_codon:yes stop_codon:yes gene_type:complete
MTLFFRVLNGHDILTAKQIPEKMAHSQPQSDKNGRKVKGFMESIDTVDCFYF